MGGVSGRATAIAAAGLRAATVTVLGLTAVLAVTPTAVAAGAPDLSISVSSTASGDLSVGDSFSYAISVKNHGTGVAHDVRIADDFPVGVEPTAVPTPTGGSCAIASSQHSGAPPHTSLYCTRPTLPAGDSVAVTVAVRVTDDVRCGEIVNSPRTQADDEPSGATDDNTASVTDTVSCPASIRIVTRAPAFGHIDETIVVTMEVTNDGGFDLDAVRVRNAGCAGPIERIVEGNGDATLAPREVWRYRCSRLITPAVGHRLSALAVVRASSDDGEVHASDRATVHVLHPGLTIQVTPDPVSGAIGETITYRYLVRNTGGSVLTDLTIDDDHLGHVGEIAQLAPGHAAGFSIDRTLRPRDVWIVDEATATALDRSGRSISASDTAAVTIVGHSGTGHGSGTTGSGTAFTGSRTVPPAAAACVLAVLGIAALLLARRAIA
jgi:uncharacterized protein DUF11